MTPIPSIFEPITFENVRELQPGEWIWDNKMIFRRAHKKSIYPDYIEEPIGFRQINVLDIDSVPYLKPFMLSAIDGDRGYHLWECLEDGRFYKFRKDLK